MFVKVFALAEYIRQLVERTRRTELRTSYGLRMVYVLIIVRVFDVTEVSEYLRVVFHPAKDSRVDAVVDTPLDPLHVVGLLEFKHSHTVSGVCLH